jgi:hypothetical protein
MEALTMDAIRGVPGPGVSQVVLRDVRHRPRAGDRWLRLFAQGGRADTAPGSGWLALRAQVVSRPEVLRRATSDEVLGVGRAWRALEGWTFARKLAVVRELVRRHPKDVRQGRPDLRVQRPRLLPVLSPGQAGPRLGRHQAPPRLDPVDHPGWPHLLARTLAIPGFTKTGASPAIQHERWPPSRR